MVYDKYASDMKYMRITRAGEIVLNPDFGCNPEWKLQDG